MIINGERRYGCWAGRPNGQPEDPKCCIEGVMPNERAPVEHQCQRRRGFGKDGLYCRMHDPDRVAKQKADRDAADKAKRQKSDSNERRGIALGRKLGIKDVHVVFDTRSFDYVERITITFEDAERLVERLAVAIDALQQIVDQQTVGRINEIAEIGLAVSRGSTSKRIN